MQTLNDIRAAFLDYFAKNGHTKVPSAPLVPHNDPTLMFTNAGMVPFKDVFIGREKRDYVRATSSQKCVRAGGKHNDLDNVGYTARHHTFFEMLGNFSFGDYFKDGAIHYGWEFVTKTLGISPEKLYVTVYHTDDEAFNLWRKISSLPESKIIRINTSDNFWAMGDTGPCGPCSEIFYDHGDKIFGGLPGTKDADGDRYVEIWNLVFMQYEQLASGERVNLPKPSIDTGAGLERIAAVMQGVHDNYDVDLFRSLIQEIEEVSGFRCQVSAKEKKAETWNLKPDSAPYRVIADHLRATSFLIADGVLPSNEGRGYVLRRIMRRAMRYAHQLGCKEPLMYQLVPKLEELMGGAYPELARARATIVETLRHEEERFKETLEKGLKLLDEETANLSAGDKLSGETAFKLYDTYGFPLDLTHRIMLDRGLDIDFKGYDKAMAEQKTNARAAWKGSGEAATQGVWYEIREASSATEFLGYEHDTANAKVVALVKAGAQVQSAAQGDDIAIVTNQTPFYGESGGQTGDHGTVTTDAVEIAITDTKKYLGDVHVHVGKVVKGTISVGDTVHMEIDNERRAALRANHSATHLLHAALRKILGEHVTQKGSQVEAASFRFDFSHPKPVTPEERQRIEKLVNEVINQRCDVATRLMTPDEAIHQGAMALFGEKYGDEVRVLAMGKDKGETAFSVELCGGTHVRNTGDIERFKIISESSVASGVRRIEGVTRGYVDTFLKDQEQKRVEEEARKKASESAAAEQASSVADIKSHFRKSLGAPENLGGVSFVGQVLEGLPGKELRGFIDEFKQTVKSGVCVIIAISEGRASIAVGVTEDLTSRFNAVDLVKIGAEMLGGKGGGGRPDMAQAGGPDGSKAAEAIAAVRGKIG